MSLRAAALLHLCLVDVAHTLLQFIADASFVVAKHRPVPVVEFLDDLKRPASVEDIAADDFCFESIGDRCMTGITQLVACLADDEIGMAHQLMERVQMPTGAFDELQRLGH